MRAQQGSRPGGRRRPPSRSPRRLVALAPLLILAASFAAAAPGHDLILPGLDPLLRGTEDPRLLGVERLILRERLLAQGADPLRGESPVLEGLVRGRMEKLLGFSLDRRLVVREILPESGLETEFRYPEYFFLFQPPTELPGGFVYYPPRPVDAPEVEVFVDDHRRARDRRYAVLQYRNRREMLDLGVGGAAGRQEGLINLTIPIKLPRTLEKIIGRGEKTNIRISGREHISISGESSRSNKFTPNERRAKPSLFPTLDMEQQLQINLSGQIGEKIFLEVDHNSEAIGPDATKIRLSYKGSEDEIIQSIETGDVGLTLPGSQLLGYSSNKSGLFGIKMQGQVGRADFTVVASKQKAESASKAFNSKGGSVTDHVIEAWRYQDNRFFRLDLSSRDPAAGSFVQPDLPGRQEGWKIDLNSVQIFRFMPNTRQQDGDVRNVVAVRDTAGVWDQAYLEWLDAQLNNPADLQFEFGDIWRPVEFELLRDEFGNLVAVDLKREYDRSDVLAVIYRVVDDQGNEFYRVGDFPTQDEDRRVEISSGESGVLYYRMKLLKPQEPEPFTWQYVLRNIYSLGGSNIDAESFDLRIELATTSDFPNQDYDLQGNGSGLEWFRIFGLDRMDQTGQPGHDNKIDAIDPYLFDLQAGLLKFPLNFDRPFDADPAIYAALADSSAFDFETSLLEANLMPVLYDWTKTESERQREGTKFRIIASHAAATSSFSLGVSNIEEGSESVVLDGRTLARDVDYSIDYTFGQITLKGDAAANLNADSQIAVNYQYAPFLGGGNSNLLGFNLGYDLGKDKRMSSTWLYESNQIVGHKPKLGEEPSRTLVGNVNGQMTFRPYFLTHVANMLSLQDSERESSFQVNGEVAMSFPNPNTEDQVYLEDFEGIDDSDLMPISRLAWQKASRPRHPDDPAYSGPADGEDGRLFGPLDRTDTRWFLPRSNTLRRHLNPNLREQEGRETQQSLHVYMSPEAGEWTGAEWGGIMRGLGRSGIDLTRTQFLELWINDFISDPGSRTGTLHVDFGVINEDFYWPIDPDTELPVTGTQDREDRDRNGVFETDEDTGLGNDPVRDRFSTDYPGDADPYPWINGTAANNREDSEDLDGDSNVDLKDGYYTLSIDLADSALVDVLRDYPADKIQDNLENNLAWRKYRIRLGDALPVSPALNGTAPNLAAVTHVRIWFEDDAPPAGTIRRDLQLAEIRFLGSRWEREGIRKIATSGQSAEQLLAPGERGSDEGFFIGEVNNKENPDYYPPFAVHEEQEIPEKEQSLVLDFRNLEQQHLARVSKVVSPRGDDYTRYRTLSWYIFNPEHELADLDIFCRLGADTLNFYEVAYRFDQSRGVRTGWRQISLDVAELSNAKLGEIDPATGWITSRITDTITGEEYDVRVVGAPDLRRIRRYYYVVANRTHEIPVSGYFYFNDVRLREVKREKGVAERVALSLNMADVIKADFDWSYRDAEFHGLNAAQGQGFNQTDWNFSTSLRANDFIPMLGFQLPVTVSRQQTIKRPKFLTNSDIEIIDDELRNSESTVEERESFSVRLMRTTSRFALVRYLVDPWAITLSGSRQKSDDPLRTGRTKNLSGSLSYDLRITGRYVLGDYGPLGLLPIVKSVGLLPSKISLSGTFGGSERLSRTRSPVTGEFVDQPAAKTRNGNLSGTFDYKPLPMADLSVALRSERDLFRERRVMGLNVGEENTFSQSVQLRLQVPQVLGLPDHWLFRPLDAAARGLRSVRPSVSFTAQYANAHGPSIRQPGDDPGIRSVSNNGDWTLRGSLPLDKLVDTIFPEKSGLSEDERRTAIERERRLGQRARRRGRRPGAEETQEQAQQGEETAAEGEAAAGLDAQLSDDEQLRLEEEALLEAARRREEEEARERARLGLDAPAAAAGADTTAAAPAQEEDDDEGWDVAAPPGEGGISVPNPLSPLLSLLRNTQAIQLSYSTKHSSSYARMLGETPFWYRVGMASELDLSDTLYAASSLDDRQMVSASTKVDLAQTVSLDVKYSRTLSDRNQQDRSQKSLQQDWPDLRLSMSGLERLSFFGGGGPDGRLRSASLDVGYKSNKTVSGYTESIYNPRTSTNFSPRLNLNFRSGLSTSLSFGHVGSSTVQSGTLTRTRRLNMSVQMRYSFQAQRLLSRLRLYKPGNVPTINLDVDLSYSGDVTRRWLPTTDREGNPDTETGRTRISVNPRLSYNITRNLSGAMRLSYSRDRITESDTITTSFGLGLEATFVF